VVLALLEHLKTGRITPAMGLGEKNPKFLERGGTAPATPHSKTKGGHADTAKNLEKFLKKSQRSLDISHFEQDVRRNSQRVRNLLDVHKRDIVLATLNPSHVRTIQASKMCKRLLRDSSFFSLLTHSLPETLQLGMMR
jgi:hypothetical protein